MLKTKAISTRLLTAAAVLLWAAQAGAQVEVRDDFERADGPLDGSGWTVHDGDWNIEGGVVRAGPATSEQHAYVGSPATSFPVGDFTLSVDMNFLTEDQQPVGRHAGVVFCMDQPGTRATSSGYLVWWIDREEDRGINLTRRDGGGFSKLVDGIAGLDEGPPANLTVEVSGPTIRVLADDLEVLSFDDDTYRGGHFGLWTWSGAGQDVQFDNFQLTVDPVPVVACFTVDPPSATPGETVTFDAGCSRAFEGGITSWQWDFGDGAAGSGEVAEHVYDFPDSYVVTLTVEDGAGNFASAEDTVAVAESSCPDDDFDGQVPGSPPVGWTLSGTTPGIWEITEEGALNARSSGEAQLWWGDPPALCTGEQLTIEFDILFRSHVDPECNRGPVGKHAGVHFFAQDATDRWSTTSYSVWWIDRTEDFGLGIQRWDATGVTQLANSVNTVGPDLCIPPRTWTITVDGPELKVYGDGLLILDVVDDFVPRSGFIGPWAFSNDQDVLFDDFSVRSGVFPPEVPELFPCATVSPTTPTVGDPVTFDAGCTQVPAGVTVTSYDWDFGDGDSATGQTVEHTYEFEGVYAVELRVVPSAGDPGVVQRTLTVVGRGEFPIFEDFDDLPPGNEVPGWTPFGGLWEVTDDGRLLGRSGGDVRGGEGHIWFGDPPKVISGDVTIEFDIEFLNHLGDQGGAVGKHAGVFFYSDQAVNRWDTSSYDVWWIDRTQDFGLGLHRWPLTFLSPGTGIEFPELNLLDPPRRWRIEVNGVNIKVFGDDELLVDRDDETRRSGHLGFWLYLNDQQVLFDNLCVVEGPAPGSPDCDISPPEGFLRGDTDTNGRMELTDAIGIFNFLFITGIAPGCLDAADADDNGTIELTDGIRILNVLFLGFGEIPPPGFMTCGPDPTPDDGIDCARLPDTCG